MSVCLGYALIYVEPFVGKRCPENVSICVNVTSLGKKANRFSDSSDFVVHILEGTHLSNLTELVVFTNLTNAVFWDFHESVHHQITVVIDCSQHSGAVAFVNSSSISCKNMTITKCHGLDISAQTSTDCTHAKSPVSARDNIVDSTAKEVCFCNIIMYTNDCSLLVKTDIKAYPGE